MIVERTLHYFAPHSVHPWSVERLMLGTMLQNAVRTGLFTNHREPSANPGAGISGLNKSDGQRPSGLGDPSAVLSFCESCHIGRIWEDLPGEKG